jgi:hypothetical protein
MLSGLLVLAATAAVLGAAGGVCHLALTPPAADSRGTLAAIRRRTSSRAAVRAAFCPVHPELLATDSGYCSSSCREHDALMQAIG